MTNEEAIHQLEFLKKVYSYKSMIEALDLAIKVLEQQQDVHDTCKKCIEFSEFKQPSEIHCEFSDENVAKAFIEDVEAVKDKLPKSSEDCRNCKKWNKCPCGKEGHENGTSIGYSIGECKDYEPCEDCISRDDVDAYIAKLMSGYLYDEERARLEEFSAYLWELPPVTPRMNLAETSRDCISRQAVIEYTTANYGFCHNLIDEIKAMPSVYPERPKGKWIRVVDKAGHWVWECDCKWQQRIATNFCPNCGSYNGGNDNGDE